MKIKVKTKIISGRKPNLKVKLDYICAHLNWSGVIFHNEYLIDCLIK